MPSRRRTPRKANHMFQTQRIALDWSSCGPAQKVHFALCSSTQGADPPQNANSTNFKSFVNVIGKTYKILAKKNVYCAMDGLKLYLQEADKLEIQEWFYNG
eukprot:13133319-Ditylum_brightwellii.AAC.2